MDAREELLRRVRDGLVELPDDERVIPLSRGRHRRPDTAEERETLTTLFAERVVRHGAVVHRLAESDVPAAVAQTLTAHGVRALVVPQGLPETWLRHWLADDENQVIDDSPFLPYERLAEADAVVTACAAAVADAGVIVLDGGPGQGRRAPTLAPACHVCVVRADQVGASMLEVIDRLDARGAVTWFGGPTSTALSTLSAAEVGAAGIESARTLIVLLVDPDPGPR